MKWRGPNQRVIFSFLRGIQTWILLLLAMVAIFAGVLVLHHSHGKLFSKYVCDHCLKML